MLYFKSTGEGDTLRLSLFPWVGKISGYLTPQKKQLGPGHYTVKALFGSVALLSL